MPVEVLEGDESEEDEQAAEGEDEDEHDGIEIVNEVDEPSHLSNKFDQLDEVPEINQDESLKVTKTIGEERKVEIEVEVEEDPNDQIKDEIEEEVENQASGDIVEVVEDAEMPVEEEGEEGEEEKSFVEISQQLTTIAEKYGKDLEEVNKIFTQVSCNYGDLEQYLITNESNLLWNPLEDYALMNLDEETIEFQYLISVKGQDKIDERKKFLQES